jgi:hypothetical protein
MSELVSECEGDILVPHSGAQEISGGNPRIFSLLGLEGHARTSVYTSLFF